MLHKLACILVSASVTFEIDTGSSANILALHDYIRAAKDFSKADILPREIPVVMHHHEMKLNVLGSARLKVEHKVTSINLSLLLLIKKLPICLV